MAFRGSMAQLEAFFWAVRLGGFHAAAGHLHRSQPTISLRIQELERTLGIRLFDRDGNRAWLTAAGHEMLGYVERILVLTEEMENRVRVADPLHGLLRLGVNDTFALACLGDLLGTLDRLYPELQVDVRVDVSTTLSDQLAHRHLDIAILVSPEVPSDVSVERLGRIENSWVASPRLCVPGRPLKPDDLVQFRVLTNPPPSYMRESIAQWFGAGGLEVRRITTCKSLPILAHLAASGCGITILPRPVIEHDLRAGRLRTLATVPPVRALEMFIAHHSPQMCPGITVVKGLAKDLLMKSGLLGS